MHNTNTFIFGLRFFSNFVHNVRLYWHIYFAEFKIRLNFIHMIRKNERETRKLKTSPLRIMFFYNPNFMLLKIQIKLFVSFTHAVLDLKVFMSRIYKSTVDRTAYNLLFSFLIC
jgi:hypothetical protein